MTDRFQAVKCPSCGAPLDLKPGHDRVFKCEFCGTTLQDQTSHEEEQTGSFPKLIIQTSTYTPPPDIAYSSGAGTGGGVGRVIGCIITIVILATVFSVVAGVLGYTGALTLLFAFFSGSDQGINITSPIGPDIYSFGALTLLPSDNDTQPDFVGVASLSDDTKRLMYVDFEGDKPNRWQSAPLDEEASYVYNQFATNNSFVYFTYETKLFAFNRGDGTMTWQTTLPDEVTNICKDCLQVTGQRIVALTADGTLQAYDAQTGQPAWNVRLNEQPRQLLVLGGNPAVKDEQEGHVVLLVYNASDGLLLHNIQPQCANYIFDDDPQEPYIYDPMWTLPDNQSVIFGFGTYDPFCIQRWDGVTGTMTWEALLPKEPGTSGISPEENVLVTEAGLYIPSYQELWFVSATDGTYNRLAQNEDYDLTPLGVVQDTLITHAERTRGTSRNEIWALAPDGTILWSFVPTLEDMMDDLLSEVAYEEGIWTAFPGEDGVYLFSAYSDPKRVGFETINLQDGTSSGPDIQNLATDFDAGSMWISILGWDNTRVWLVTTDVVRIFNYQTGEELIRWP